MQNAHSGSHQHLARILDRAIGGEREALQQLLTAYQGRLRLYVNRKFPLALAPMFEPEDFVQQGLAQASLHITEFTPDGDDAFYRWLVTITRREMVQALRSQRALKRGAGRRKASFAGVAWDKSLHAMLQELAVYERTPSQSAVGHEAAVLLSQALDALDPPMRDALRGRFMEQQTLTEVAERIGRTERAVQALVYRGLKKLRESLESRSHYM